MDRGDFRIILKTLYVAFAVSTLMLGIHLVSRFLASDQTPGFASQIHYQLRMSDMLIGILSAFITVVWLPRLAACSRIESPSFIRLFTQGLRQTFICVLVGLYCLDPALDFLWGLYFEDVIDQAAMQQGNGAIISLFAVGAFSSFLSCLWVVRNDWKTPVIVLSFSLVFIVTITTVFGIRDIVSVAAASLIASLLIMLVGHVKFSMTVVRQALGHDRMVLTSLVVVLLLLGLERLCLQIDHLEYVVTMRIICAILAVGGLSYYYIYRDPRLIKL